MKVVIIGGGLVGSLSAVFFGRRGHNVELYECRPDPRKTTLQAGRSINLALSTRGRTALRNVGLEKIVLEHGIPMYGRMIHATNGQTSPIIYDPVHNNCIYSIGRKRLNEILLDGAEKLPNVTLHFERKLHKLDADAGAVFLTTKDNGLEQIFGDLIVGADGAHSIVRKDLIKASAVSYSLTYIDHGYLELSIPPDNMSKMAQNYLHIWPRNQFMMIALPNQDGSWTVTLFMPFATFQTLRNSVDVLGFFKTHFPDVVNLIGADNLVTTYMRTLPSNLVSVKCARYHHGSKVVIIGDAAHAMVPFYGQGMNAGFEDCTILDGILHNHDFSTGRALELYSLRRNPDAEAICDLAMYNYIEMRALVNKRSFLLRKYADNLLYYIFGSGWVPLYQSVTFSNTSYRGCVDRKTWQDSVMKSVGLGLGVLSALLLLVGSSKLLPQSDQLEGGQFCQA